MEEHGREAMALNRSNWEARVAHHAVSEEYGLDRYVSDPAHLSDVVRFDLPRLGDITGLDTIHLQCHIGTDTVSLARLGAHVTGLDFSPSALEVARRLAVDAGADVTFVESDVHDAVVALGPARFDLVYTGIGALCWLPDVRRWADVVAGLLRPGGRLFLREGHPMLWALDDPRDDGLIVVRYPYFETAAGTRFREPVTYVDHPGELDQPWTYQWNHGLSEIFTALAASGLRVTSLEEHDSVPWPALGDLMDLLPNGEYRLREQPERLACSYTLCAVRDSAP